MTVVIDPASEICETKRGDFELGRVKVIQEPAREILTRASGFMGDYDFTLNPYSGCSFGCTYCYAAFFSRDAGSRDTWGHWVRVKSNAVELLDRRLQRRPDSLDDKIIYMSSVTDPYQPVERRLRVTRGLLETMAGRSRRSDLQLPMLKDGETQTHGSNPRPKLVIQTRSPDVVRDCDLFHEIEANGGRVRVNMTVTTDDEDVRRTFEPFCPSNSVRLSAIGEVQASGVESCITMTPLLLVDDPDSFVDGLLATGVDKFIVQPFHFQRGKFVAATRDQAFDLMAEKLGTDRASFRDKYLGHYQAVFDVLQDRLPELGEGKDGFAPPF